MRCYLKVILVVLIIQLFFTYTFTINSEKKSIHSKIKNNEKFKSIAKGNISNKVTPKAKTASNTQLTTNTKMKASLVKKSIKSNMVKNKPDLPADKQKNNQQPTATSTKKMQSWYEVQIFDNEKNKKPELEMLPQDEELLTVPRSNIVKPK